MSRELKSLDQMARIARASRKRVERRWQKVALAMENGGAIEFVSDPAEKFGGIVGGNS